jgi:type II secretory pathway pseudopilin PulG
MHTHRPVRLQRTLQAPRCAESTRETILKKLRDWVELPLPPPSQPNHPQPKLPPSSGCTAALAQANPPSPSPSQNNSKSPTTSPRPFSSSLSKPRETTETGSSPPSSISSLGSTAHMRRRSSTSLGGTRIYSQTPRSTSESPLHRTPDRLTCRRAVDPSTFPRLIVIDGLDECKDTDTQCDILAIIAQTILAGLPYPFRFLVASRPEGHINRTFDTNKYIKQIPVQKYDLSKDSDASKDIRTFLQQEFETM